LRFNFNFTSAEKRPTHNAACDSRRVAEYKADRYGPKGRSMRNKLWMVLTVLLSVLAAAGGVSAHHGTAAFDRSKLTVLKGTVTNFIWANPHGGIEFDVKDSNGKIQKWEGSLTSPNWLARAGWTKNSLKPGDMIIISGNQSKNRPNSLWITRVQLANGQELPVGGIENLG
jgi:hypothetical protein